MKCYVLLSLQSLLQLHTLVLSVTRSHMILQAMTPIVISPGVYPLSTQTEHRKMALADLPSEEALWEGGEFALAILNEVALSTHEVIKLLAFLRYHHPGVLLHAQS